MRVYDNREDVIVPPLEITLVLGKDEATAVAAVLGTNSSGSTGVQTFPVYCALMDRVDKLEVHRTTETVRTYQRRRDFDA